MDFAVIGGDRRMAYAAAALSRAGHREIDLPGQADLILLPMPLTTDGVHIRGTEYSLAGLLEALPRQAMVFGGGAYPGVRNYGADAVFCLRNAALTAEGALALAVEASVDAVGGSRCLILGGGRIAMCLCRLLTAMGARVTLFARRALQRTQAALMGADTVDAGGLGAALRQSHLIFNTIPARVAAWEDLFTLTADALWIELASSPFGIPPEAAGRLALQVVPAGGLPGRMSPRAAGEILADTVLRMLAAAGETAHSAAETPEETKKGEKPYAAE